MAAPAAILAEGQAAPRKRHREVVGELLAYLATTASRHLELPIPPLTGPVVIKGQADANLLSERARQGLSVCVGDSKSLATTCCRTQRQTTVSVSTAESEIKGLSWAGRVLVGFGNLLKEVLGRVGVEVEEEHELEGDNSAANLLARREADLRKIRHVDLADLWVREATAQGRIRVTDVSTDLNGSDVLTKCLSRARVAPKLPLLHLCDTHQARMARHADEQSKAEGFSAMRSWLVDNSEDMASNLMAFESMLLRAGVSQRPVITKSGKSFLFQYDAGTTVTWYPAQRGKLRIWSQWEENVEWMVTKLDRHVAAFLPAPPPPPSKKRRAEAAVVAPPEPRREPADSEPSDTAAGPEARTSHEGDDDGGQDWREVHDAQRVALAPGQTPSVQQYVVWARAILERHDPETADDAVGAVLGTPGREAELLDFLVRKHLLGSA